MRDLIRNKIKEFLAEGKTPINTKVVDKNGKPLMMYHGGSYSSGDFKGNIWFTVSKKDANYYAKQVGGNVTKAYLIVTDPLYSGHVGHLGMEPTKEIMNSVKKRGLNITIGNGIITFIEPNNAVLIAQDIGKDGVIDLYNGEIVDVVVFNNNQIIIK